MSEKQETGKVKWFSPRKGYGFLIRDNIPEGEPNHEIFVHYSSIQMDGFRTLFPNLRVSFTVAEGRNEGTIEAKDVKIIAPNFVNQEGEQPKEETQKEKVQEKVEEKAEEKEEEKTEEKEE